MAAPLDDHDTLPPSMDPATGLGEKDPPRTWGGILRSLGPGLIIAGSIVGSGELIATTKTGAEAGISLLWLVLIGCVIKVFVQIELGRYTLSHGETTLAALDRVPGPRLRVNWIVWFWMVMFLAIQAQLGAIVGGVGQALAIAFPITGDYQAAIAVPSKSELARHAKWEADAASGGQLLAQLPADQRERIERGHVFISQKLARLEAQGSERAKTSLAEVREGREPKTRDDIYWSVAVTLFTIALLYQGKYGLIQNLSTALVVAFTFVTVGNVIALQNTQQWSISAAQFLYGLSFHLPAQTEEIKRPLITALATFGIIGVGASELVAYPYWCMEKGYARFTGRVSNDPKWGERARGWMMVMHYDAFASMIVYTIATLAFFIMGVAVMHSQGLNPDGMRMVGTLLEQYVPVFGEHARWLFLLGAFAVLFSTFLVANAGNARMLTDGLKVIGLLDRHSERVHLKSVSTFCVVLPLLNLAVYCTRANPVGLVLLGGTMQALMLPLLAFAALYFRYTRTDARLRPGRTWDGLLILSCLGLMVAGAYLAYAEVTNYVEKSRAAIATPSSVEVP